MIMDVFMGARPLWAVLVSILAAFLILASRNKPNLREFWTLAAAVLKIGIVYSMLPAILRGETLSCRPLILAPGIELFFRVDAAGMLFAALASALWLLTSVFSIGYMRSLHEEHQTGYYASFALCLSATMGIAFAGNLLTFFIFFEMLTLATYPLVVHERNEEALKAGRQYLTYTLISGQMTLVGIVLVYLTAGQGNFIPGGFMGGTADGPVLAVIFLLLLAGPAVKAGMMPFHGWLPAAMVAPTPVSALLHAVAVVKAGCFGVLRIIGYVFDPGLLLEIGAAKPLALLSGITIVFASLIALTRPNLKQRLAYSTIGQLSYIVLGAALGTSSALIGSFFHLFAHGIMKITLFFTAGAIYTKTHDLDIRKLSGLGLTMPLTFMAYTFCALGIAGMPLAAGFISKWNLLLGASESGQWGYAVILIISGLLACGYLLPVAYSAFRGERDPDMSHIEGEPNLWTLMPLLITSIAALVLGIFPDAIGHFYSLSRIAAENILTGTY